MSDEQATGRWRGVIAVALTAAAIGILANRPSLVLLAVIGIMFAVYPIVTPPPTVTLELDRRLSNPTPADGESVEVSVTVTNVGSRFLPDLRVVDGVPAVLRVVDGSPRRGMALTQGGSVTFAYEIEAKRGKHAFEPATVVARDVSGSQEVTTTVAADTEIDCTDDLADVPLRKQTQAFAGHIEANRGGSGIEFHRTREYRHGDPTNRIDWNRLARTGDLTTIEFDENQAVSVMLVVDARSVAYRGKPNHPHAVAYEVSAASQLLRSLHSRRNWVGVAGLGRSGCWLEPGSGREHVDDATRLLATDETFSSVPPTGESDHERQLEMLRDRLAENVQAVILSPLCDDEIVELCLKLEADGNPVTVISPDVTGPETPGGQLAAIERANRLSKVRRGDIAVFEWIPEDDLSTTFETARVVRAI